MVVVYPEAAAAQAAARAQLRAEMVEGVEAMSSQLRDRVNNGGSDNADLPSLSEIKRLTQKAIAEVESIDQPVGESTDQMMQRLGLGPATRTLAQKVRDS